MRLRYRMPVQAVSSEQFPSGMVHGNAIKRCGQTNKDQVWLFQKELEAGPELNFDPEIGNIIHKIGGSPG